MMAAGEGGSGLKVYAGTSGYSYDGWKGSFYPGDLPARDMLRFYGGKLPAVEIDNTFYRLPKASVLETWTKQVPEDFRFVIKASRRITHFKRLKDAEDETSYLLRTAAALGDRLGLILFQLPPNLRKDIPRLQRFLDLLPEDARAAFEFRHPSWLDDKVLDGLRSRNLALCLSDAEDEMEPEIIRTARRGYVRLRRPAYTPADLSRWANQLRAQAWDETYVFFNHEEEGAGPELAARFLRLLERGPSRKRPPAEPAKRRARA
jgi:uncharacterized protein YecE (DUF72 family)